MSRVSVETANRNVASDRSGPARYSLAPQLSVRRGAQAVEFYRAAFGAVEEFRVEDPTGAVVCRLAVQGAQFWVSDESPEHGNFSPESLGGGTVRMILTVPDPDTLFASAIRAGAKSVFEVGEAYGWRLGRVVDPYGHHWEIGHPLTPTALVLIDAQVNMFDPASAAHDAGALLDRLADLLVRSRAAHMPVFFVRNSGVAGQPDSPGTPGWEIHPMLQPVAGEVVVDKTAPDAFQGTVLGDELEARGVRTLVVAGLQSEHCVRATVLGALARGKAVTLVSDGHSTYDGKTQSGAAIRDAINAELSDRVRSMRADQVELMEGH